MSFATKIATTALSAAIVAACALPQTAHAQSERELALEARVAELERMVQSLVSQQQTLTTQQQATAQQLDAMPAARSLPAGTQPVQATSIMPNALAGTRFSYGGFIKFDAMATDTPDGLIADGSAGRLFYLPGAIPVGGSNDDAYTDVHAQFSRFWFGADSETDNGDKLKAYLEFDLFGGGSNALLGNEVATNTHGLALRQAYVSWNKWLAGQTWSNFQDTAALPDAVDFVGTTEGTIFVRQAQIRYTNGPWSVSLENPETTVQAFGGATRSNSENNVLPDATARWITKGDWGHFTVAGLLRQLRVNTPGGDQSDTGAALSASGKFVLGPSDDIRYMVNAGSGIGRYLGFGISADAVANAGGDIDAIDGYGAFAAWRHVFSPKVRTNLMYSTAMFDNDKVNTGFGVTEKVHSFHANVIYTPIAKLDVGAELIWAQRQLEDAREGDLRRLHMSVKYNF
ncbi:DcaP family trimeric outer membrane transporter [Chiayiivirga flava]|uniref:Porin n=1 Tax=Chiayiivirga flava TaxID=659595 RepID=A0A7W8D492_9GAMM|nr:DcaP family trimeric outer membrane transporter [Chiayiivirga flava]MBB5207670.1 hypothetical protein [Chiayiivirga flava]